MWTARSNGVAVHIDSDNPSQFEKADAARWVNGALEWVQGRTRRHRRREDKKGGV